jgi:hypothetical protein
MGKRTRGKEIPKRKMKARGRPQGVLGNHTHACGRKVAMPKHIARKAAKRRRGETGEPIWPYECEHCGFWHIGHSYITEREMHG